MSTENTIPLDLTYNELLALAASGMMTLSNFKGRDDNALPKQGMKSAMAKIVNGLTYIVDKYPEDTGIQAANEYSDTISENNREQLQEVSTLLDEFLDADQKGRH